MAYLASVPVNQALSVLYSLSGTRSPGLAEFKLSPKDASGTVLDLTGYNTASLIMDTPTPFDSEHTTTATLTVVSADASGIVLKATPSQAATIAANMVSNSTPHKIAIGDGTDDVDAARGTLTLNIIP